MMFDYHFNEWYFVRDNLFYCYLDLFSVEGANKLTVPIWIYPYGNRFKFNLPAFITILDSFRKMYGDIECDHRDELIVILDSYLSKIKKLEVLL